MALSISCRTINSPSSRLLTEEGGHRPSPFNYPPALSPSFILIISVTAAEVNNRRRRRRLGGCSWRGGRLRVAMATTGAPVTGEVWLRNDTPLQMLSVRPSTVLTCCVAQRIRSYLSVDRSILLITGNCGAVLRFGRMTEWNGANNCAVMPLCIYPAPC